MNQAIYLKLILVGIVSMGLSHAMEQTWEKMQATQMTSVERVENKDNTPSVQKKASISDIWMCIEENGFHRRFKVDLMNNFLPDEVRMAVHQIDPTVEDERMLSILESVAHDEDNLTNFDLGGDIEDDEF